MFEKIGTAAEKLASNISESRRGFLGRLGRSALAAAGMITGLLVLPKDSRGSPPSSGAVLCCRYTDGYFAFGRCINGGRCRNRIGSYVLYASFYVADCTSCPQ